MTDDAPVTLEPASAAEAPVLANLLELYVHDLSAAFPDVVIGEDGRFGYARLPLYWTEPDRRYPFLMRCDGRLAGFALAKRGSPAVDDPSVLDVAEFFVLRSFRRSHVGERAARLLWQQLPGNWVVRASESNPGAVSFWRRVIAEYTGGAVNESVRSDAARSWRIFRFTTGGEGPR